MIPPQDLPDRLTLQAGYSRSQPKVESWTCCKCRPSTVVFPSQPNSELVNLISPPSTPHKVIDQDPGTTQPEANLSHLNNILDT